METIIQGPEPFSVQIPPDPPPNLYQLRSYPPVQSILTGESKGAVLAEMQVAVEENAIAKSTD